MDRTHRQMGTSAARQFWRTVKLSGRLLAGNRVNLALSAAFPLLSACVTVWLSGKDMFAHYNGTKPACFVLVCAAIWCGLFNSIQIVVRDRKMIRRDYAAGMRLGAYIGAKAFVQFLLCLAQSAFLTLAFPAANRIYDSPIPTEGLCLPSAFVEYYLSIFLLMYAADTMGLFVSCIVRRPETANSAAPYILIVQILFSGVLFPMEGSAEIPSYAMLSRWGMEALGSVSNLNALPLQIQLEYPMIPHNEEEFFTYSGNHLLRIWLILAGFSLVFLTLGTLFLRRVGRDTR